MDGMTINHIVSIDHGSYDLAWNTHKRVALELNIPLTQSSNSPCLMDSCWHPSAKQCQGPALQMSHKPRKLSGRLRTKGPEKEVLVKSAGNANKKLVVY